MNLITFREAYCREFGVSPEVFEEDVLWRCFYPEAVSMGKFFWRWKRRYFDVDFELIREVADCTTVSGMRDEMNDFRYHRPISGFWRKVMHVRLSGQRLVALGTELLPEGHLG